MLTSSALAHLLLLKTFHRSSQGLLLKTLLRYGLGFGCYFVLQILGFLTLAQLAGRLLKTIRQLFKKKFSLVVGRRGQSNYRDSGDGAKSERDPRHVPAGHSTCGRGGDRLKLHRFGIVEVPIEAKICQKVRRRLGWGSCSASCVEWEQVRSAA